MSPLLRPGLALVALSALVLACDPGSSFPTKGVEEFVIDDPLLAALFLDAAQQWTDAGVVAAARVTVNLSQRGMRVKWALPSEIAEKCGVAHLPLDLADGEMITGCARHRGDKFYDTMWITLSASPAEINANPALRKRITANIMHELMHVLLPTPWHVPRDQPGVMNSRGGEDITEADLAFIREYTEVVS